MQVTFVDDSQKKARRRVERVLDTYLHRVARATWRGRLSAEGLRLVAERLKRGASRHTAVACYIDGRQHGRPVFHIGSQRRFNADGHYAVATHTKPLGSARTAPGWRQLQACVDLAGLLHDVGKASAAFQSKLRASADGIADPVRHELISAFFVQAAFDYAGDDAGFLALVQDADPDTLETLYATAADRAANALKGHALTGFGWDPAAPVVSAIRMLVATHHKLLAAELTAERVTFQPTRHINPAAQASRTTTAGTEHAGYPSVFRDPKVRSGLQRAACDVERAQSTASWALTPQTVYAYGRLALMLGDHYASSQSRPTEHPAEILYANTRERADGPQLAQPLADHLVAVAREARGVVRALRRAQDAFPAVSPAEIPSALTAPTRDGRFAWQGDAVDKTRGAEAADTGFFGIAMVRTGGGKTRGCPAVLNAASHRCRFFLGLGLRTLALQSGDEYAQEIGFRPWHLATIIGSEAARRLHAIEAEDVERGGTSAVPQDVEDDLVASAAGTPTDFTAPDAEPTDAELATLGGGSNRDANVGGLPHVVDRALGGARDGRARALLETPVIAATADQVMAAADARGGSHLYRMLRLATSDLILDEIDCYDVEDLAAICRLVFLAGAFGRKVVIASATVPPAAARALFTCYYDGWTSYAALTGASTTCVAGWITDVPELTRLAPHTPATFPDQHTAAVQDVVRALDADPRKRRVELVRPAARTPEAAHEAVTAAAIRMHGRHAFTAEGVRISVGVVRFANIRSCRTYARTLLHMDLCDTTLGVVCYHARLLGLARFQVERGLNRMLKRGGATPNAGVLREPAVQDLIARAKAAGHTDVMIVVVASPVEETGRDHDFDYAVVEPSSTRALIQMAGRVLRHRLDEPNGPNIALLDAPMRYYRGEPGPYYRYPGVETPIEARYLSARRLNEAFIDRLLDVEALGARLDARLALREDDVNDGNDLTRAEHELLREALEEGAYAAVRFGRDPDLPFASWMPENRRFRRGDDTYTIYRLVDTSETPHWYLVQGQDAPRPVGRRMVETDVLEEEGIRNAGLFPIDLTALLREIEPRFGTVDRHRLCREVLAFSIPSDDWTELTHDPFLGADYC